MIQYSRSNINRGYIIGDHQPSKIPGEVMVSWLQTLNLNQVKSLSIIPTHQQTINTIMANGFMIYMNEMDIDEMTIDHETQSQIIDLMIIGCKKFFLYATGHAMISLKKDITIYNRIKNDPLKDFLVDTHKESALSPPS